MCHINSSCSYAGYKFTQSKILSISETFLKQTVSTILTFSFQYSHQRVTHESQMEVNSNPNNDIYDKSLM